MLAWYQAHMKEFETPARVRWEELMISFAHIPTRRGLRQVGGTGQPRTGRGLVGRSGPRSSEGAPPERAGSGIGRIRAASTPTSSIEAIFSRPIRQLSQILESDQRLPHHPRGRAAGGDDKSFLQAQKQIKARIENERLEKKQQGIPRETSC